MTEWTLSEFVAVAAERISALPAPKNGQVRAVPDDRTVRYYGTLGLLDKPALRGRTAIYGPRQLAQVIAIKRLQATGRSLAEIQTMWTQLDDAALARMSGIALPAKGRASARAEFWKRAPVHATPEPTETSAAMSVVTAEAHAPVELRIALAPNLSLSLALPTSGGAFALSPADVDAIRAAAAPLVAELARRQLTPHAGEEEP